MQETDLSKSSRQSKTSRTKVSKPIDFAYAFRSFVGYLEGTEKSLHTIKNYKSDLKAFQEFLEKGLGSEPVTLSELTREDLEKYLGFLKAQGFRTNTRRRKLLTVRKLLGYLTQRNKLDLDVGKKLPAPGKVERVPFTGSTELLIKKISVLSKGTEIDARNRILLWTLAETGCQVSEVSRLRYEQCNALGPGQAYLSIVGKAARQVPISVELLAAVEELKSTYAKQNPWIFLGHNRAGALGAPISPRGVELLVKSYGVRLEIPEMTPRTFRHSIVLHWYRAGVSRDEIQKRLGLRTPYAFRVFEPLLKDITPNVVTPKEPKEDGPKVVTPSPIS